MLAVTITLDVIWFARNKVAHGDELTDPLMMTVGVRKRYHDNKTTWTSKEEKIDKRWEPPEQGVIKINYDVSVQIAVYFAAISRNKKGEVMHARTSKIVGHNPLKGEASVARMVSLIAETFVGITLIIEGDCLELVDRVIDQGRTPDWEIAREVETIRKSIRRSPRLELSLDS